MTTRQIIGACLLGGVSWLMSGNSYAQLLNDSVIHVTTSADVTAVRKNLISYIWGTPGFPSAKMPSPVFNIGTQTTVANLPNLKRVDELDVAMDAGEAAMAWHFVPQANNSRLVIIVNGHFGVGPPPGPCIFDDQSDTEVPGMEAKSGLQRTIAELLREGYGVLAMFMPRESPEVCATPADPDPHTYMFSHDQPLLTDGSHVMKFFLEPVAVYLNYLSSSAKAQSDGFPAYTDFNMTGLSGGGWTATVYPAIDPRITLSVPVAGSLPLYLRQDGSIGDEEQTLTEFYQIAGYPDLYVLASDGPGRRQVQVLNRYDTCCFGPEEFTPSDLWEPSIRAYELGVRQTLKGLGAGNFRLEIDEAASGHMISWNTLVNVLLAELAGDRRTVGAADASQAFVRGMNGTLWTYNTSSGWTDLGFPIFGSPAVLKGAVNAYDVFYRNFNNGLMHAYLSGGTWTEEAFSGTIITDPVAVSAQAGTYALVALGQGYQPFYWSSASPGSFTEMSHTPFVGQPAIASSVAGTVDFFGRNADRSLTRLHFVASNGTDSAVATQIGGAMQGFPSAVTNAGVLHAYVRGLNDTLFEASNPGGSWQWISVSSAAGVSGTLLSGSPGARIVGSEIVVRTRTHTSLATFTDQSSWTFSSGAGAFVDSPANTGSGTFARGVGSDLRWFNGTTWVSFGGEFD